MEMEVIRRWAFLRGVDIHVDDLVAQIALSLDALHPVARLRFELEYRQPKDAADCLVIVANAMARHYRKSDS